MSLAANPVDGDQTVTWLIVGGCPRSATTALGRALNKSRQIALFHEYPTNKFFYAMDGIFTEELRQEVLPGFERHSHLIPRSNKHGAGIVRRIFSEVFPEKSTLRFVGTKTPSYELMPPVDYPQWISEKTIHITRNPYDVVLSGLKKNHPNYFRSGGVLKATEFRQQLHYWVSAWNHAVLNADNEDFLHLFYDDLINAPELQKELVSDFLGGIDDFDFLAFKKIKGKNTLARFAEAGLEKFVEEIEEICPYRNWLQHARRDYAARTLYDDPSPKIGKAVDWLTEKMSALQRRLLER